MKLELGLKMKVMVKESGKDERLKTKVQNVGLFLNRFLC